MNGTPKKNVGLALGGGFIRSVGAIGVIEVLEENNIPIDMISGCSAGSGIAAAYAAGTLEQLKKRLVNGPAAEYWRTIIEPTVPRHGLLKGERNRKFFKEFVGDMTFADLQKKVFITATDLKNMEPVILDEGSVADAIQAAVGVPGIFIPVQRGNQVLVDGGNFNLIPSSVLYTHGANYVIAVDFSQPPSTLTRAIAKYKQLRGQTNHVTPPPRDGSLHIFALVRRAVHLSSIYMKNFYHSSYRYDTLIKPNLSDIKRWDVKKVSFIIEEGRNATLAALPQIKQDLGL